MFLNTNGIVEVLPLSTLSRRIESSAPVEIGTTKDDKITF